jgi:SAM-dependent methyltransferase
MVTVSDRNAAGTSITEKALWIRKIREKFVDPQCAQPLYERFLEFAEQFSENGHYLRNCQTMAAILNQTTALHEPSIRVLECGGLSLIGKFLNAFGYNIRTTSTDLRYSIDASDSEFDIVLSLEVIEHIKDQTEESFSDLVLFNGSGVQQYCREMARVTAKGGFVVLTTPNPCSVKSVLNICEYKPPELFRPHVREYSREELVSLMKGFDLVAYDTHFSFFLLGDGGLRASRKVFEALGVSVQDRGDDHFMLFRRV